MENNREFFELKYTAARVRAARRIEEAALGQVVGVNGYTTVVQAQRLCEHLDLEAGATLLDVGAGRGWPGSYIAENSINGLRTAGGIREPIMLRLNVTIADQDQKKNNQQNRPKGQRKAKTTEPFVNIGLTETAADVMFGISWTK